MFADHSNYLPITTINRKRFLPVRGKIMVRKGQRISANDTVARAELTPQMYIVDIGKSLGIKENFDRYLKVGVGQEVSEGDILAGPVGIAQKTIRSPKSGRVVYSDEGQVIIRLHTQPYELKSGMPGVVSEIVDDRGITVTVTGALIQGVWGNSRVDTGLLNVVINKSDDVLTQDALDISMRGMIIFGGHCEDATPLQKAEKCSIRGLILSSIRANILEIADHMEYPIIVMEGFGKIPLNTLARKLLTTNEKREVTINAQKYNLISGIKPEIIIPLPGTGDLAPARELYSYEVGQQVRITRAPYQGKIGKIFRIHSEKVKLQNGIVEFACDVRLEDGAVSTLPLVNLQVLGSTAI
jgi:transcription antitermination factor NusG